MMSKGSSVRRRLIRLVQLSPVVALLLLAFVWFSLPSDLSVQLASQTREDRDAQTPQMRSSWLDASDKEAVLEEIGLLGPGGAAFPDVVQEAWKAWVDSLPSALSESDVLSPTVSSDAPHFRPIETWEKANNATVWAWVVTSPPMPAVVASASADPDSLRAVNNEWRNWQVNGAYSDAPVPDSLEEWLWGSSQGAFGRIQPLSPDLLTIGGGGGGGSSAYMVSGYTLKASDDMLWRAFVVYTPASIDEPMNDIPAVQDLDPAAPELANRLKKLTEAEQINIWLFGPLEWRAIPLRVPAGKTAADAQALAEAVWPGLAAVEATATYGRFPQRLGEDASRYAGDGFGTFEITSVNNTGYLGSAMFSPEEVAPQTVAWLAVFDRLPSPRQPGALSSLWLRWQRFAAAWFPTLLGGGLALLVIALIVSPAAFLYERRLSARERLAEELQRMRRDAHDKVYNRLSALSKRVATAGDDLAAANSAALAAIAEDIRTTVAELQGILGDETLHVNAALTAVPLEQQVRAVGTAQAALLDVAVEVTVSGDLPEVEPRIGWDVQCIVEEAVSNAVRHGGAGRVSVNLGMAGEELMLVVSDDGSGSTVTSPDDAATGSTGLRGMRDRLARYGGSLELEAGQHGTTLSVRLPLSP